MAIVGGVVSTVVVVAGGLPSEPPEHAANSPAIRQIMAASIHRLVRRLIIPPESVFEFTSHTLRVIDRMKIDRDRRNAYPTKESGKTPKKRGGSFAAVTPSINESK
jgi:hypothetical protein